MKYKILLSVFSLIGTILITLVCWWIWDFPILQSDSEYFLLTLIEILLYNTLKIELIKEWNEL